MNDDRQFVTQLEQWLETRDAPISASRLSEEILEALPRVKQDRPALPGLARPASRGTLRLLAVAAMLTVAVGGVAVLGGGTKDTAVIPLPTATPTPTPTPTPPDPYPDVVRRLPLGADTWQVHATDARVWVQTGDVGLTALDPRTGEVVAEVPDATWMFAEGDDLWVQKGLEEVLVRVDPLSGEELDRIEGIPGPFVAKDGDTVWSLIQAENSQVIRTDLETGERLAVIDVPAEPKQIVVTGGSVWVACDAGNALVEIDRETYEILDTVDVGSGPVELELGFGSLWVRNRDLQLVRVDPETGTVLATIDGFANSPSLGLSFGGGYVWGSTQIPPGIAAVDPATNEVVRTIPLPGSIHMDSFWLDETLWVTTANSRELLEVDAGNR